MRDRALQFFTVTFGDREAPRMSFTAMARTRSQAWDDNLVLREGDEDMDVQPAGKKPAPVEPFPVKVARQALACAELRQAMRGRA